VDDLARAKRIASVLELLERVSRSELAASERTLEEAKRLHSEAMASLSGNEFLGGPFADLAARRLPKLSAAAERHAQTRDAAHILWRARRMRAIASAERVTEARDHDARVQQKRELDDLLDALFGSAKQASGKPSA
jgi:hypothetical protein